jgi:polysaccharide biosynthesis/export protein
MLLRLITLTALSLCLAACSGPRQIIEQPEQGTDYNEEVYAIGVSDELAVSVWKYPELSTSAPVRPDGKISVPLVGDVLAAGKSPEKLSANIAEALKTYVRNPQVTVVITSPSSTDFLHRVRVTGAVETPTSVPYRKGMTVLDLVLLAGGTNDFASPDKAKLYRKSDGQTKVYPIYLGDILNKGKLDSNYNLLPSDVVTVPERSF